MKDLFRVKGHYEIKAFDKNGRDITNRLSSPNGRMINGSLVIGNTITNAGLAELAGLMTADVGGTGWDYSALGTDNTAPTASDTALGAEITTNGGERAAATGSRVTTTVTNDTMQLVNTFNFTGALSIREVGIFNAATGGTMLSRQLLTFDASSGDSIQVTYKVTVASA